LKFCATSPEELAAQFERLGPWVTRFPFGGHAYGGDRDYLADTRVKKFLGHVPQRSRILDLGAFEGGHSIALAWSPGVKEVVAVEGQEQNFRRAAFVIDLYEQRNVTLLHRDVRTLDLATLGTFDAVFCSGLLYHLPEPWKLIERCAAVAPALYLWTHYAPEDKETTLVGGYHCYTYYEGDDLTHPFSALQRDSLWLTLASLYRLLREHGYKTITLVDHILSQPQGPAVSLFAFRG
jgi:SAM-dependent methyltransferase